MDKRSRVAHVERLRALIDGIKKRLGGQPTVTLLGKSYTPQDLVARIQEEVDAMLAVDAATAARAGAVVKRNVLKKGNKPLLLALESFARVTYGESAGGLWDYGLEPRKPQKKTVVVKNEAAQKAKVTRETRGTMGPRQRKKAKGAA